MLAAISRLVSVRRLLVRVWTMMVAQRLSRNSALLPYPYVPAPRFRSRALPTLRKKLTKSGRSPSDGSLLVRTGPPSPVVPPSINSRWQEACGRVEAPMCSQRVACPRQFRQQCTQCLVFRQHSEYGGEHQMKQARHPDAHPKRSAPTRGSGYEDDPAWVYEGSCVFPCPDIARGGIALALQIELHAAPAS